MKRYKRIEITAFRRCVTVTSGETRPDLPAQTSLVPDEGVWLNDADSGKSIEFESKEGQLILAEAVRSLERRLTPEARAAISAFPKTPTHQAGNGSYLRLQSLLQLICPKALRFIRKEN